MQHCMYCAEMVISVNCSVIAVWVVVWILLVFNDLKWIALTGNNVLYVSKWLMMFLTAQQTATDFLGLHFMQQKLKTVTQSLFVPCCPSFKMNPNLPPMIKHTINVIKQAVHHLNPGPDPSRCLWSATVRYCKACTVELATNTRRRRVFHHVWRTAHRDGSIEDAGRLVGG